MSRRSRQHERKEETRRELVTAATKVFAARGFHAASLAEIAAEAGYTTGAVYWHFRSKGALFIAAFEAYALTRVRELTELEATAPGDFPARARALADHWMERQRRDPTFMLASIEFLVHAWRDPELRDALAARHAAARLTLANQLERETREAGLRLPMPAEAIATVMRELGVGLALAKLADPDAFSDELFGQFVETFYRLAAGSPTRRRAEAESHGS